MEPSNLSGSNFPSLKNEKKPLLKRFLYFRKCIFLPSSLKYFLYFREELARPENQTFLILLFKHKRKRKIFLYFSL